MNGERFITTIASVLVLVASGVLAQDMPSARVDLVQAEIYGIDQAHSTIGFGIDFFGLTTVHGTFNDYSATILYDEVHPERSSATLIIRADSIDTNNQFRDRDLKAKFFETDKYPEIRFQSTRVEAVDKTHFRVRGVLTIKDVSKEVTIPMTQTISRRQDLVFSNLHVGGTGSLQVNRKDYHVDDGGVFGPLADDVALQLDILANRFNYDKFNWSKQKPSIGEAVYATALDKGGAAAAAQLVAAKEHEEQYAFDANQVSIAINRLMQRRRVADALPLLKAAIGFWPDEAAFHNRAGEAYAVLNDRDNAIREYERALSLNPHATEAIEMLRRLKGR